MSSKGLLSVFLLVASVAVSNFLIPWPNAFEWNSSTPVSGGSLDVKVSGAPCQPVTVVLTIGNSRFEGQITEAPGSISFKIPEGLSGAPYTLQISCPQSSETRGGQIM